MIPIQNHIQLKKYIIFDLLSNIIYSMETKVGFQFNQHVKGRDASLTKYPLKKKTFVFTLKYLTLKLMI